MATRQPKGRPAIYLGADGEHHCWLPTGEKYPSGRPKRKHIHHPDKERVAELVAEAEEKLRKGQDVDAKFDDYSDWLDHWLANIIMPMVQAGTLSRNTYDDYESISRVHLKPKLGFYRLTGRKERLEPEHHDKLYATLAGTGLSPDYIARVHAVARRSQRVAYKRGKADRVVADLVDPPKKTKGKRKSKGKALKLHEAQAVLTEAVSDRDELGARWVLGLIVGPRCGEVCGFKWATTVLDPDPGDVPHIMPEKQIQRFTWQHGCDDPVVCVKTRVDGDGRPKNPCKTRWCPPVYEHGCEGTCGKKLNHFCPERKAVPKKCNRHTRLEYCRPCPDNCTDHASTCPRRRDGGVQEVDLKTEASEEAIALPDIIVEMLRGHRERQIRQFAEAGRTWSPDVHLFLDKRFKPIDGRRDWGNWQALLERAKVKRHRLHSARHTTGTFLRATGHDMKMIKEVLRHANPMVSDIYTEEMLAAKQAAVSAVAELLMQGDLSKILVAKKVA